MARIRTIKPEMWDDDKLARLPIQANLLLIGMLNFADDTGVIKDNASWIRSKIFSLREDVRKQDVQQWIDALIQARILVPFQHGGEGYLAIRTFKAHQRIDRPQPSKIPADVLQIALDDNSTNVRRTLDDDSPQERKGKESKGVEPRKVFVKPTQEEIEIYMRDEKKFSPIDAARFANKFWNKHESIGWLVGKNKTPMVSWKHTINTWLANESTPVVSMPQMPKAYPHVVRRGDYSNEDEFQHFLNSARKKLGYEPEIAA